jgi:flagellar biogenesis protein FliO
MSVLADKQVLVDPHPAWGGIVVGIIAIVIFVVFAAWIIVQRIKHGREGGDD